ncbi:MAG TPA: aromatic acid exporter family protein [Jatrophihabitans sp.]|nr:aromatic acid exporter family protein [Jatrophihabitans sp.]
MARLRALTVNLQRRLRERGPASLGRAVRLSVAALAAYTAARFAVSDPRPVTAALTALLIVQVTLFGTITDTARRILSVLAGVGAAIAVSTFVGFTWWSLGALVALSILLGQALRLGPHLLEVPISAMLILAAGGAGAQATDRVVETLVGAAVGLLVNVLVPPSPRTRSAGDAVEQYGRRLAALLERVSQELSERPVSREQAVRWLHDSRSIASQTVDVDRVLTEAHESRRLNPRAVGTTDPVPDLRGGLDALEHSAVALRAVFRSLADGAGGVLVAEDLEEREAREDDDPGERSDEQLRRMAIAALLGDLARSLAAFGALVRAEAEHAGSPHNTELVEALDAVGETRARMTELLLVNPRDELGRWQLHGSLLAGIERVVAELDIEEFGRRKERRRREAAAAARRSTQAAQRVRSSTRRVLQESPALRRARRWNVPRS